MCVGEMKVEEKELHYIQEKTGPDFTRDVQSCVVTCLVNSICAGVEPNFLSNHKMFY